MLDEPPGADPHAGWCGEGGLETRPYPIRCDSSSDMINAKDARTIDH